ncbi:hypothetical protein [Massilia sp. YIM B04103]|uniref:hypothetical protein n=1 Tax=Massilia sp. YIM B04103 TaxID=2963106 RepID=UPI00210AFE05|nr:hypothetical protein [Massilia sp. YIM B04103]
MKKDAFDDIDPADLLEFFAVALDSDICEWFRAQNFEHHLPADRIAGAYFEKMSGKRREARYQEKPQTDWQRFAGVNDEEIDLSDDLPAGTGKFTRRSEPYIKKNEVLIGGDVYRWFEQQGPDFAERINQVLRQHIHKHMKVSA